MLMRPLYAIVVVLSCCVLVVAKLDSTESLRASLCGVVNKPVAQAN
jgi:hypothetical protein